jgi:hypothetical protein
MVLLTAGLVERTISFSIYPELTVFLKKNSFGPYKTLHFSVKDNFMLCRINNRIYGK